MICKADIILAAVLIVIGLALSYAFFTGGETGHTVYITVDGKEYADYPLNEDRTVTIERGDHINKITIKDGQVSMTFSDCSGQDCIHQGKISQTSQSITCLPNRVVIEIRGDDSEYDAVIR